MKLTEPLFDERELDELRTCLSSGWVTQGPMTAEFERLVSERHQARHALATTSCTSALHISAMALELGPGDEVVAPAFTWITSANAAEYVGARTVFADVDAATFNLDPAALEAAVTPRTRAVVAVHLFGLSAPMTEISAIAKRHGLAIIEDAACAIGTTYKGHPVGTLGDLGCFSFHPRKAITTGEGGLITTNRDDLASRAASLRNHGSTGPDPAEADMRHPWTMARFQMLGYNYRMSDIQAAVGVAQMAKLDSILERRIGRAFRYNELLAGTNDIVLPRDPDSPAGHTYQSYVIRIAEGGRARRNAIMQALKDSDIETRPGTHAVHRLHYYAEKYGLRAEDFPVAASCEDTTITLPLYATMTDDEQDEVVGHLTRALSR